MLTDLSKSDEHCNARQGEKTFQGPFVTNWLRDYGFNVSPTIQSLCLPSTRETKTVMKADSKSL